MDEWESTYWWDYRSNDYNLEDYAGFFIEKVVIEDGVTSIGSYVFSDCYDLIKITIPNSVTKIGEGAFCFCTKLPSVDLPDSLISIGNQAFQYCEALESVVVPGSVKIIGDRAFEYCSYMKEAVVSEGVESINWAAFANCSNLRKIQLPSTMKEIGDDVFSACEILTEITIPSGIRELSNGILNNCTNLETVNLPEDLKVINDYAFSNCTSLVSIKIPDMVTEINDNAFLGCTGLTELTLPDNGVIVGWFTFGDCTNLKSVTIPNGRTHLGMDSFNNCTSLSEIWFMDDAVEIHDEAFVSVTAKAYYPAGNPTWTEDKLLDYGGEITWVKYCYHETTEVQKKADPTCTAKGFTGDKVCTACGEVLEAGQDIPARGHTEAMTKAVEATCEQTGLTEGKHCSVCNAVLVKQETVPAKGHSFGEWKQTKAPTCTEKGTDTRTCACGKSENRDIATLGHTEVTDQAVEATCEKTGLTEGKHCSVCNAVTVKQETVPAKGHSFGEWKQTKAPTCTEKGTDARTCACGKTETRDVAPKGHTEVTDKAVAATCTATGLTEGKHCSVCNAVIVKQETVPAKGHSWDGGKVTKEATETAEGEKLFTCTACGETKTEIIPTKDHVHKYTDAVTAPTCTAKGYTTHTCACGHSYTDSETAAKGHTEVVDNAVAATCTATGLTEGKHCSVCNAVTVKQETVPVKDHSWDGGKVTKEATEETEGIKTFSCAACGETRTESIPKLNHTHKYNDAEKAPTCTEKGYTVHTCTCGHTYTDNETAALGHTFANGKCTACGTADPDWVEPTQPTEPEDTEITRLAGAHRYETAFLTADQMKINLGIEKFDTVVVASGTNFADALSGSYLAAVKNAPILLACDVEWVNDLAKDYIRANLKEGGTIYILGGEGAVPASFEAGLDSFTICRLAGNDRFQTNLLILKEAGVGDKPVLVCTGLSFADSLSASATELPILLVWKELTADQKAFLAGLNGNELYVIGGESAVSTQMEQQVAAYGVTERVQGKNRFETSIAIAEHFFYKPESVVLAYAWNFPDGLCGGSLAVTIKAPLILTMERYETRAAEYIQSQPITQATILGGEALIPQASVNKIFP